MQPLPWDMIGAIIGGLGFLITLLVEWNKLGAKKRVILAIVIGVVAFFIVNSTAPLLFPTQENPATETPHEAPPTTATLASNVIYL